MTLKEIQQVARERGIRPGRLGKVDLVRKLQQAEGYSPCFETRQAQACGQSACLWRKSCR